MRVLVDTPIDIIITDVMMPDVDGIELIPMLLRKPSRASVVFSSSDEVVLSAAVEIAKGHGLRLLGALRKPLTPDKLRPLLELYLTDQGADTL